MFLAAALTDYLDGHIARRRGQVTRLGQLLDPIADKLLISAALISLVENQLAPAWAVVIIIGREFAVTGLRSIAAVEGVVISASKMGKFKMLAQVIIGAAVAEAELQHRAFNFPYQIDDRVQNVALSRQPANEAVEAAHLIHIRHEIS